MKMIPIKTLLESDENQVNNNIKDKRKRKKCKTKVGDLLRTNYLRNTFSKGDTTNWSYDLQTKSKIIEDKRPGYYIKSSRERYNQAFLENVTLIETQKDNIFKKLKFWYIKVKKDDSQTFL